LLVRRGLGYRSGQGRVPLADTFIASVRGDEALGFFSTPLSFGRRNEPTPPSGGRVGLVERTKNGADVISGGLRETLDPLVRLCREAAWQA
jgi:hypothetical protein